MQDTAYVWSHFGNALLAFVRARVAVPQDAEDIVQEIMIRVHRSLPDPDDMHNLRAWLYRIARNAIIDHYRTTLRRPTARLDDLPEHPVAEAPDERDIERCIRPLVESLPPSYRQAVRLADLDGLPQAEVARRLGLSLSGAKSRIQRGRILLRGTLESCCSLRFDTLGRIIDQEPTGRCPSC